MKPLNRTFFPFGWTRTAVVLVLLFGGTLQDRTRLVADDAAELPDATLKRAVDQTKAAVPAGWTVAAFKDSIKVSRDQKVESFFAINAPGGGIEELRKQGFISKHKYEFTLNFGPRMDQGEYKRKRAENVASHAKLRKAYEQLRDISHKFDSFLPSNADEKRRVAEYERLKKELPDHKLPNLYDDNYSIWMSSSFGFGDAFVDENVAASCYKVRAKVELLFESYEPRDKAKEPKPE